MSVRTHLTDSLESVTVLATPWFSSQARQFRSLKPVMCFKRHVSSWGQVRGRAKYFNKEALQSLQQESDIGGRLSSSIDAWIYTNFMLELGQDVHHWTL